MAVIAVAGGTGNIGRTIVEAIIATGKHDVKILARTVRGDVAFNQSIACVNLTREKASPDLEKQVGATIIVVDYANVEATAKSLEDNNVHTIVSAINMMPGSTRDRAYSHINNLGSVPHKLKAQAFLENETKSLEYTVVHNGFFLDYWEAQAEKSHMAPFTLVIDIPNNAAAIPGSGNVPVAFTHTRHVAKFVTAALDLEKWESDLFIVGDKATWNEFLRFAEEAKDI